MTENIKVHNFIDYNKPWFSFKLSDILPKYIEDNIIGIPIPVNDIQDWKFTSGGNFLLNQSLGRIMVISPYPKAILLITFKS